ncbi:MAG: enoyl-CoA hydratase-related protein [Acidobacteriota bacterium]
MEHFKHCSLTIDKHTARVVLNRPPVNALNREFVSELTALAGHLGSDDRIHAVALSSALPVFCAGADLKERAFLPDGDVGSAVKNIQSMVRAWCSLPQPLVVQIRNSALGGGLELALAGDIIIAADDAQLGFPELRLGIIPAAGGTQLLTRRANAGVAKKWILTGIRFSGSQAARDGVIDTSVASTDIDNAFEHILQSLSQQSPLALRQAKKAINDGLGLPLEAALDIEQSCYEPLIRTRDRREALQAFLEKRDPVWTGD